MSRRKATECPALYHTIWKEKKKINRYCMRLIKVDTGFFFANIKHKNTAAARVYSDWYRSWYYSEALDLFQIKLSILIHFLKFSHFNPPKHHHISNFTWPQHLKRDMKRKFQARLTTAVKRITNETEFAEVTIFGAQISLLYTRGTCSQGPQPC